MKRKLNLALCLSSAGLVLFALTSAQAQAAGFEKADFWDAHYAAIGSAAQSSVVGPQALYWNPAGLAGTEGLQVNGDISPTFSKFSGPFTANNAIDSNSSTTVPGAAFISYEVNPKWTAAVGYYVTAANRADYDNVNVGVPGLTPNFRGDLTMTELSVGTGYEILPGLKLGAAYRMLFVSGEVADAFLIGGNLATMDVSGISKTAYTGFRVGLQWAPKDAAYGFGITYRNRVPFVATGSAAVGVNALPSGSQSVEVLGNLPQRVDAAAHYHFDPNWTGFLGYTFTNYSDEQTLGISGVNFGSGPTTADLPLNWMNMHNVRLGGEYSGITDWPIRAGFVWTSQVTPVGNASPLFASPGSGYTVIAGTGHSFIQNLTTDAAVEYSWDSGAVAAADNPAATTAVGDYAAHALVLHLSATYAF